mmetsp:Transcript_8955/g.27123  ORF Transcript_8955/g.27123 Transcript_8955/m.27123 type:complete len:294 (+) Transcript_8955:228-1109(+)
MTLFAKALLFAVGAAGLRRSSNAPVPLSSGEKLLAGGSARFSAQLVMYPFDALRTLAQTRKGAKTLADLGAKTLVKGAATTSSFAFFVGGLQFSIFAAVRPRAPAVVASACASLGSCVAGIPQEVIKQRLVTGIYPNFRTAVRQISKTGGVLGFYEGWRPTVARNLPFVVVTFCTFDALKHNALKHRGPDGKLTTFENYAFGVGSALAGALATQPIDVVKTRLMTQAAVAGKVPYKGVADCVGTMFRNEGPGVFMAGLKPRMIYMGPLWAMQFGLNGQATKALQKRKAEKLAA